MEKVFKHFILIISVCAMLTVCGGANAAESDSVKSYTGNPLDRIYNVVLLQKVEIDPQMGTQLKFEADYPTAVADYENSLLSDLRAKNRFREVDKQAAEGKYKQDTLLVKSKVLRLRIASGTARFWFGPMAGTSEMDIEIKLVDAETGNILREKILSTANNPFGAVFAGGSSDRSLPADMGKIIAAYILTVTPEK
jgi:hypothetical protein